MPRSTSPAATARSTRSVETSSTISTSPSLLSRAYSSAASSENDPRMPITPTRQTSPTGGHLPGEAGEPGGQRLRALEGNVVHGVLEPGHAGVGQPRHGQVDRRHLGGGELVAAGRA